MGKVILNSEGMVEQASCLRTQVLAGLGDWREAGTLLNRRVSVGGW